MTLLTGKAGKPHPRWCSLTARCLAAALISAQPGAAVAGCASPAQIERFVDDYINLRATVALGSAGTLVDAICTQGRLAEAMSVHLGPVVGYKAGLTSQPARQRFGATEPVRGVLYQDMMLPSGASVPMPWGAVPLVEADLVLEIGDSAVNAATSWHEVMQNIRSVRPFIELADLALAQGEPMTAETITAMGVGVRLGVLGAAIPVEDPAEMTEMLAQMQVELRDGAGELVAAAPGSAVLGHPAETVLWLHGKGVTFKAGDLVSVGSFGPLVPPTSLKGGASVTYSGLTGDPVVSVIFAPTS